MINIIVVFPQQENARSIRNILVKNGFHVVGVCVTGTQAVSQMDGLNGGIVICGYKMADMLYSQLHELLPSGFEMLLLASGQHLNECLGNDIVCVSMPLNMTEEEAHRYLQKCSMDSATGMTETAAMVLAMMKT